MIPSIPNRKTAQISKPEKNKAEANTNDAKTNKATEKHMSIHIQSSEALVQDCIHLNDMYFISTSILYS